MIGFIMWSLAMVFVGASITLWFTTEKERRSDIYNETVTHEVERHLNEKL